MLLFKIRRAVAAFFIDASSYTLLVLFALYVLLSYVGMLLSGESALTPVDNYLYWLFVTMSTVGYGDFSPDSSSGKLFTALFVIPVGLSLFAVVITKIGFIVSSFVKRGEKGLQMIHLTNHCVLIGWNGTRTFKLIKLLLAKANGHNEKIVLVVDEKMDNPMTGQIEFVVVENYTHVDSMQRANIAQAARIIIDTQQDDVSLTTALFCRQCNPDCHKTVYFQHENMADLLLPYCPNVEVVPSVSVEMMARSSVDPGSSQLHKQLLDPTEGSSQFSSQYTGAEPVNFKDALVKMKEKYNATLLGIRQPESGSIQLNPAVDLMINQGDCLFYIANNRLKNIPAL